MAKTRNGTRIDIGSMPYPIRCSVPSCHTTAASEQLIGSTENKNDCE